MTLDIAKLITDILLFLGLFYPVWPVVVLLPLGTRRNSLSLFLIAWGFSFITWIGHLSAVTPYSFALIPEPVNTVLFFATGVVLVGVVIQRIR